MKNQLSPKLPNNNKFKNVLTGGRTDDRANDESSASQQEHEGDSSMVRQGSASPESPAFI